MGKKPGTLLVKLDGEETLIYVLPENLRLVSSAGVGTDEQKRAKLLPPEKERGVVILPPTSTILQVSVFSIFKDRLQQLIVRADAMRGAWFLLLYVLWILSYANILVYDRASTLVPPSADGADAVPLDSDVDFSFGGSNDFSDGTIGPAEGSLEIMDQCDF